MENWLNFYFIACFTRAERRERGIFSPPFIYGNRANSIEHNEYGELLAGVYSFSRSNAKRKIRWNHSARTFDTLNDRLGPTIDLTLNPFVSSDWRTTLTLEKLYLLEEHCYESKLLINK